MTYRYKAKNRSKRLAASRASIDEIATPRILEPNESEELTFSIPQCAKALGFSAPSLYLWIKQGRFPAPKAIARNDQNIGHKVYTYEQVEELSEIMARHSKDKLTLGAQDFDTINQLQSVV